VAPQVALAHDYLTQRGGAERVALIMAQAFPGCSLYTTLYEPDETFPEFATVDVRPSALNRVGLLRKRHRLAMPVLAPTVSRMHIDTDVLLASSSGWAHGMKSSGRKIVYCHAPARWLYQRDRYLGVHVGDASFMDRLRRLPATLGLDLLSVPLRRWDRSAAASADQYLANSTVTRDAIRAVYAIDAEVVPPPPALPIDGAEHAPADLDPGFFLCVARLLPYKNVDAVIGAVSQLAGGRLVVVGGGPDRARLERLVPEEADIRLLGRVDDAQLRWLYRNCEALVAASYEDYGLSPLEAASFGRPSIVLKAGGYLDTVVSEQTGIFFDEPTPASIVAALRRADGSRWDESRLLGHASAFSVERFQARLRELTLKSN
jgi:glycosyltransferase involved in cell wall biosynthesis